MQKKDLFLVLYSDLRAAGGGIESWLIKFLENRDILSSDTDHIYILFLNSDYDIEQKIPFLFKDSEIQFISIALESKFPLIRGIEYQIKGFKQLQQLITKSSILISVGTYLELFLIYRIKKRNIDIKKGYWIRNVLKFLLKTRHTGIFSSIILKMEAPLLKSMDFIIANGEDTFNYYRNEYNLNNLYLNKNAVDESKICINEHPFENNTIRIGYIGRLVQDKGIDSFLKSIELYNSKSIEFVIIGSGDMEEDVKKIGKKMNNVLFYGAVSNQDVYHYLSTLDATVHLTYVDSGGLSNSLLESIFSDNLIICWNTSAFTQILNDENAILIEHGNVEQLSSTYTKIAADRGFALRKIQAAKKLKPGNDMISHMNKFLDIINII
ncbi:hypothetical protein AGMMS49944_06080 [Spirochaetia bacterium]|nr:hypothetical protein AGMMS49944_06080 [Spirochaetia bacterium]